MTVQRDFIPTPAGECPPPVSLETMAVIEQVLGYALRTLRARITPAPAQDPGAIEYESWLRGRNA